MVDRIPSKKTLDSVLQALEGRKRRIDYGRLAEIVGVHSSTISRAARYLEEQGKVRTARVGHARAVWLVRDETGKLFADLEPQPPASDVSTDRKQEVGLGLVQDRLERDLLEARATARAFELACITIQAARTKDLALEEVRREAGAAISAREAYKRALDALREVGS
jgi:DNA-binding transcriptional ArsR family regulator